MTGNKPCKRILNSSYEVHTALGPGLMESVHEVILHLALPTYLLYVEQQKGMAVFWESRLTDMGFRADRIVESKVFIEIKSVDRLAPVHSKQGRTYLKISGIKPGFLVHITHK